MKNIVIHTLRGFTLIELLVTIAVFSIVATAVIILINPQEQLAKANDGRRKNDLVQLQKALEVYYQDNQRYPPANNDYEIEGIDWGTSWAPYMSRLPIEPNNAKHYGYIEGANGQSYALYASLDRGAKDPQAVEACGSSGQCINAPLNACGESVRCNFGVSSPNITP